MGISWILVRLEMLELGTWTTITNELCSPHNNGINDNQLLFSQTSLFRSSQ